MSLDTRELEEPFGPPYPALPTVAKFRRMARGGLSTLSRDERRAYGDAVEKAILALQRSEFVGRSLVPATPRTSNCASGTFHSDGADIHEAILQQQRSALLSCPGKVRRARQPAEWRALYNDAMADKRERQKERVAA